MYFEMTEANSKRVDLTNCDREQIHIPGAILPHGAMLVVDPATMTIEQAAGDLPRLLGHDISAVIGQNLSRIFSPGQVERLGDLLKASNLNRPRHLLDPLLRVVSGRPIDASVHQSDGALIIEVEDADLANRHAVEPLAAVQEMFDGLGDIDDLGAYCQRAAERVRSVTGYDRVMVYRFLEDESGWVFGEARRDDMAAFLDLHYPASDIPKQARALYLKSWLRLITEVDYEPAPLQPAVNPRSGRPLDMSFATLRDVSPIHREYLRNMGVDASMSISIICEGRLWGLFACHHTSPRRLPRHLRAICELFGSMFSLQLESRLRAAHLEARLTSRKALADIMHALAPAQDYAEGLAANAQRLLEYVGTNGLTLRMGGSGGLAIRVKNGISTFGGAPTDAQISALTDWLCKHMQDFQGVFSTDRLGELYPPAAEYAEIASGLLAMSVSREPRDFVLWFRPEIVKSVSWGGDPRKPVETGPNGDRLTPRKSFQAWLETVRGRSSPWSESDTDAVFDLRVALLDVVLRRIDAAARERLRAWEQEQLLMAELDHRVKNTLANIQALVSQTSRGATSLTSFTEGLQRRIRSMSRAHSLLTQSRWEGVSVTGLIHEELAAYKSQNDNITILGPAVTLLPKSALALSLAIHELATNAAKYGALSVGHGRLDVNWQIDANGRFDLNWRESDGPEVTAPERRGFGTTLIERVLAIETGGRSKLLFQPDGVTCSISMPIAAIKRAGLEAEIIIPDQTRTVASPDAGASTQRILIVEDSALVVMVIENVIDDLGWTVVGPAMRLKEAVGLAGSAPMDAALLDINLNGEMSWDVAAILQDRGIPFLFVTGYDGVSMLPKRFAKNPILNKPFNEDQIAEALKALVP